MQTKRLWLFRFALASEYSKPFAHFAKVLVNFVVKKNANETFLVIPFCTYFGKM